MGNPIKIIKKWFFELIEDALGSKAIKQFKNEEKKQGQSKKQIKS